MADNEVISRLIHNPRGQNRIGGSDIGAICGESDWKSAIQVFCRMTGRPDPMDGEVNQDMEWGIRKEPVILDSLEDSLGLKFIRNSKDKPLVVYHPEKRYQISPDGLSLDPCEYAEVKSMRGFKRKVYFAPDGIERQYQCQVQFGMGVLNDAFEHADRPERWLWCRFRALFDSSDAQDFLPQFDESFYADMQAIADDFIENHVEKGIEPDIDSTKHYRAYLVGKYGLPDKNIKSIIDADNEDREKLLKLSELKASMKETEAEINLIQNQLFDRIGENYGITGGYDAPTLLWYGKVGSVSLRKVVDEICEQYNIPKSTLEEIESRHRGKSTRVPKLV